MLTRSLFVAGGTFFLAVIIGYGSQLLLEQITSLIIACVLLVTIILIGVIFDTVGTAVTVASESTFHSMACKRIIGSNQAIHLVRNADRVANFCNDVVGDIAGTLSGAVGAAIVFSLVQRGITTNILFWSIIVTALVAAITVGGKAFGKTVAIDRADEIIFMVGQLIARFERFTGRQFLRASKNKGRKR